ncbi:MAG: dockerin type I domain-containing protein, partial [Chthoniobacterales bacterium]
YKSTDGGNSWTNPYTGPMFIGPCRTGGGYFAVMFDNPAYWGYMGWGQPAARNNVVHYVYAECGAGGCPTSTGDPANVFYIRSTDGGATFSAPFMLNTDGAPDKGQWEPSLSLGSDNSLFAVWYDERERTSASCQPSSPTNPCYRMWARKSTDGGATWLPDMPFSDVVSPLPLGDPGNSYDYGNNVLNMHLHAWVDGRNPINGASQADVYFDREPSAAGLSIVSAVSRKTHGAAGPFDIDLPLTGTNGVECRTTGGTNDYTLVVTFSGNVTVTGSPQAQLTMGVGCVGSGGTCSGSVTVSGNIVTVPLTNITNAQNINVRINGVNSAGADASATDFDIPMGVLWGDTNANRTVNAADVSQTKARLGQGVDTTNFRSDVNANGSINGADVSIVKSSLGNGLP